jgi:hypothetical protein
VAYWIDSDKAVVKRRPFGVVGNEILLLERASQGCRDLASFVIIDLGKKVNILCRSGDKAATLIGPTAGGTSGPTANQLSSVDQFTDVIQSTFHEHDLVQITRRIGSPRSHRTSRGLAPDQNSLAGRPTLPWSEPRSSSSVRGTDTSRTQPGRLISGVALPVILVMVPQTGSMYWQVPALRLSTSKPPRRRCHRATVMQLRDA